MLAADRKITIPFRYVPRAYQVPLLSALDSGVRRAIAVWHRRAGKEKTIWNATIKHTFDRKGLYLYLFPTSVQARKVLWDGIGSDGLRFLDHVPPEMRASDPNTTEMKIWLRNGSLIQVGGIDNPASWRGTNPVWVVFAEYSYQDPVAWDTLRPILAENKGTAIFDFTPNGNNHAKKLFDAARSDPAWFVELQTVRDTKRDDGTPVISDADIEAERRAGMDDEMIEQEFFCSFSGVQVGAYYSKQIRAAESEDRITRVPWQPNIEVETWWDLGMRDATAIWFTQTIGREVRVIDYYENAGEALSHYAKILRERPYVYGDAGLPHDAEVRELGTGKSRREVLESLGFRCRIVPNLNLADGIDAGRAFMSGCWFDAHKCQRGLDALRQYHKQWDEERKCFRSKPEHDWSSHGADSYRYLAVGHQFRSTVSPQSKARQRASSYAVVG